LSDERRQWQVARPRLSWDAVSEEINLGYVISNALSNSVSDISRFIEFYISRNNTNRLKRLYVCGGGSLLKGLTDYFSASFSISVKPLPLTKEIEYKGKKAKGSFETDYIYLINAIGALIRV
jgi:type IV pilus assembly protein PilM